ncbi:MAG: nuclear transport factor 2 family protein [Tatlockia sp.]|nr:nuclear transport factor 2 family protein [Tatlockia sp.]
MISEQSSTLEKLILQLEQSLLDSSVRKSFEQLNKLIADDFVEFGSSGKIYNKQDCIDPNEKFRNFKMIDFEIKELSKEVILANYKTIEEDAVTLRSSVWKHYGNEWKMLFHQGTKVPIM